MTEVRAGGPAAPAGAGAPGYAVAVLAASCGLFALLQLAVTALLPRVQQAFALSPVDAGWIVSGHLLVAVVATPVLGRLGDLYGRRALMLAVLAVLAAAGVVAATAGSFAVLLAARLVQGVAAGLFPLAVGLLREGFPRLPLGGPSGLLSASFGIGGGAGIVLAGLVPGPDGFRTVFWIGTGLALVLLATGAAALPETPRRPGTRIDAAGLVLLGVASGTALLALGRYGTQGLGSPAGTLLLGAAALAGAALVVVERRAAEPVIEARLLRRRPIWTLHAVSLLTGVAMFQTGVLAPVLAFAPRSTGYGLGAGAGTVVAVLLPMQAGTLTGGLLAARLAGRVGARALMVAGTVLFVASPVEFALLPGTLAGLAAGTALTGLATGVLGGGLTELIARAAPGAAMGVTVGLNSVLRNLGGSFGVQASFVVLAAGTAASTAAAGHPAAAAYRWAFAGSALLALGALGAALAYPKEPEERGKSPLRQMVVDK